MNIGKILEHLYMFINSYIVCNLSMAQPSRWLGVPQYGFQCLVRVFYGVSWSAWVDGDVKIHI
jgi:hypothetical protein